MNATAPRLCASCARRQGKRFHWCGDRFGCICPCSEPTRAERRVLLALLSGAPRLSGYPLSRLAQAGPGLVYAVLWRLEDRGWVAGEWGERTEHGRRRFYSLTPEGREHVTTLLGQWAGR